MCVCQICNQSLTNVKVYIQIYIDIFIHVSLGDHNEYLLCQEVEIWSAMYPDLNLHFCARVAPGSCPGMGLGVQRAGAFVYFGHMSTFCCFMSSLFLGKTFLDFITLCCM